VPYSQKPIDCCKTGSTKPSVLAIFTKSRRASRRIQVLQSVIEEAVSGVFIWLSNFKPFDALVASLFDIAMKYPG
jgi:hypothetical protein